MAASRHAVWLLPFIAGACLFTGEGTDGLPCNNDDDCAELRCVEGVCGGQPAGGTENECESATCEAETEAEVSDDGEPRKTPTEQELPQPCVADEQTCINTSSISICSEGKLRSWRCEALCGMDRGVGAGCLTSPLDGIDYCWCEGDGVPSDTCSQPCFGDSDCNAGEYCADLSDGRSCAPTLCRTCFSQGQSCGWSLATCQFRECG